VAPAAALRRTCLDVRGGSGGRLTDEQSTERLSELLTHATVDEEVDRVAEEDDEVDEDTGGASSCRVHQQQRVERVLDDHGHHHDGQWDLDEQEHTDHHEQHACCPVGLGQSS